MAETGTSKGKSRPARAPAVGGVYRVDSVKVWPFKFAPNLTSMVPLLQDVADSLGITNLPDSVAAALASDVEYRLHQVIEVRIFISSSRISQDTILRHV